jgi:hypothetical protein
MATFVVVGCNRILMEHSLAMLVAQHGFYAESLRDHLGSLATGVRVGTISLIQSHSLRLRR